ncbi:MAG: alanine racemase [Lachnospiraceae bacterium]|nr:alanine racemase [Lachnospiraceae bacterium]
MNNTDFIHIAKEYGTPAFVFDEDELLSRALAIKELLGTASFCYSIKANPFLIPALSGVVGHFEVCSPGELEICRTLGVAPEKIIYSGVMKRPSDIRDALAYGVGLITAESERHFDMICSEAASLGKTPDVILRFSSKNQFGMSLEDIEKILEKPCPGVNITGLHYFAGTGRRQIKKQREELTALTDMISDLNGKYGRNLNMLEYGPGLPFPYFEDEDGSDTLHLLKELAPDLAGAAGKCTLSVEMGRFLASSCGYYITSICDIKRSFGTNWIITDGGINHVNYLGQMMGMKVPVIMHLHLGDEPSGSEDGIYTICGALCTANDVLVRELSLSGPAFGDILVFSNIGAYSVTEAPALFLSRDMPCVIAHRGGSLRLLRGSVQSWKINIQDS